MKKVGGKRCVKEGGKVGKKKLSDRKKKNSPHNQSWVH